MDLDLRLVRYFTVVADELHFGRAASRLTVAQPALSRQIRRLERSLGVELFDRSTRHVALTDAGTAFLPKALRILEASDRAVATTRGHASTEIRIGFSAGLTVTSAVRAFQRDFPHVLVRVVQVEWFEQSDAVRSGRVDICVGRLPIDPGGTTFTRLYDEERVVLLPVTHRLAGKESVSIMDLADDPIARHPDAPSWDAFWRVDPRPGGRPAPNGPTVKTVEEKLEYVAAGDCIAILPASAAARYTRDDVCSVPISDIPPSTVVATVRSGPCSPMLAALVDGLHN